MENLLTCPKCGATGFINLKSHRCKNIARIDGNTELITKESDHELGVRITNQYKATKQRIGQCLRDVVATGALMLEAKSRVQRGGIHAWLLEFAPEVPERTAYQWMALAQESFKLMPQIKDIDIPAHQLLIAAPETLSAEERAVQGDFFAVLDGKTQNELLWGFKSQTHRGQGGDNEFLTFLTERHPDLLVDGNPPKRNAVPKDVQAEFNSWKMSKFDPNERVEAARNLANDLADRMVSGIRQLLDEQAACGRPIDLVRRDILIQLEAERVRLNTVMKTLKIR